MRTGNKPSQPRSPLGALQSEQVDKDALKAGAWRNQRILVIAENDHRLTWPERESVKQLGERLYGS